MRAYRERLPDERAAAYFKPWPVHTVAGATRGMLGSVDISVISTKIEALKKLIAEIGDEQRPGAREGLSEDELAIFDLLIWPKPNLTGAQKQAGKKVAHELLERLRELVAVF